MFDDTLSQLARPHLCLARQGKGDIAGKIPLPFVSRAIELNVERFSGRECMLGLQRFQRLREQLSQLLFHCFFGFPACNCIGARAADSTGIDCATETGAGALANHADRRSRQECT